ELEAGQADGVAPAGDDVLANGGEDDAALVALGVERAVVEDDLVERAGKDVAGLEAHRGVELLALEDGGKLDAAHDETRAREADPHRAAQLVLGEQGAQLGGERG